MPATPERRVTQRAPQSCVFCTRRKLRCSKTIPCSNCVERHMEGRCHREAVILSRSSSGVRQDKRRRVRHRSVTTASVASPPMTEQSLTPLQTPLQTPGPSPDFFYNDEGVHGGVGSTVADDYAASDQSVAQPIQTPAVATDAVGLGGDASIADPEADQREDSTTTRRRLAAAATDDHNNTSVPSDLAVEAAMSLECLAWGAHHHNHQHYRAQTAGSYDDDEDAAAVPVQESPLSLSSSSKPSALLPPLPLSVLVAGSPPPLGVLNELDRLLTASHARAVLHFHKLHVAWMHNVVYMPFFVRECEAILSTGYTGHPDHPRHRLQRDAAWVSLYCAILCTGVYYMSEHEHQQLGIDGGYAVARRLYQLTVEAITASDFMVVQSLHSLQAICVLVHVAHAFGDTRRIKVLLVCANTIGQNLGHRLHLMGPALTTDMTDEDRKTTKRATFEELINRQVRKRVWCFLCTQDWYLIASKKAYSIVPEHSTTPVPANCREDFDDVISAGAGSGGLAPSLKDHPLSVQTQSTYMIFLFRLTSIYRSLFDQLCAVHARGGSVADCFDHVLAADSRLEAAMGEIEEFSELSRGDPSDTTSSRFRAAQWRALVITSWHQRVMIHRTFFCRSFQDKRYHYSRFVCLAAARKILRSYLDTSSSEGPDTTSPEIWSIPTHAISGCIILTLHALFTAEKYTLEKSDLDLVQSCLAILRARPRPNSIVDRGIQIIQHLLHPSGLPVPSRPPPHNPSQTNQTRRYRRLDLHEISQLARDIDIDVGGSAAVPMIPASTDTHHAPLLSRWPAPQPAPTPKPAPASPPLNASRGHHHHGHHHHHDHGHGHNSQQPGFYQALLHSQLDAFNPGSGSSFRGDDELFMPWWFDSMPNGYRL